MNLKRINPLLLLFFLNIIFSLCFFTPIIGRLNHIMLASGGDGIKNYFTYLYFIKYDSGTHFTGMNYPFGENMVFTDNMPALAWPISKFKIWFPGIVNYGLAIMHSTFIIAYFLCSFYVFKILRLFNVKGWWLLASSIFIAYFSPQFWRIFGHFGLGLPCFFPMAIYWLMQYDRSTKYKYLIYTYCTIAIFTFLHVYYLAFALILIGAYSFAMLIARGRFSKKIRKIVPVSLVIIFAILTFKIYLKLTDTITDRPVFPIGYLGAVTTSPQILTSKFNFIGRYVFSWLLGGEVSGEAEGYCYPGLITILCVIYLVFRVIKSIVIRIRKKTKVPTHPVRNYRKWLIVALLALLFSMGVPFIWGLDFLIDYFSALRQFRSLGRFAWIFYYLMSIYSSVFLYRWFLRMQLKGHQKRYIVLAASIAAIWLIEWNGYGQSIRSQSEVVSDNYKNFMPPEQGNWIMWLRNKGYSPRNFQASAGIPYFHIGSEKLGLQNNDYPRTMFLGSQIADETGIGMMNVMMSRTSWSQTFEQVRFFDGPFTGKKIAQRLNDKPLLLFVNKNVMLSSGESYMLRYGKFIGNVADIDLYSFTVSDMLHGDKLYSDSCLSLADKEVKNEGLLGNDNRFSYSQHFDNGAASAAFIGKGGHSADPDYQKLILTIPVNHPTEDTLFVFSIWMHCFTDRPEMPEVYYQLLNDKNEVIDSGKNIANSSTYITQNWYKAERIITIKKETRVIKFNARGGTKEYLGLDELLIQPLNSIYFYKAGNGTIMLNNRPVSTKNR
jgi:hypothetical protein